MKKRAGESVLDERPSLDGQETRGCGMELCAGTLYIEKSCVLLDQHKIFLRCEVDSKVLQVVEAGTVLA